MKEDMDSQLDELVKPLKERLRELISQPRHPLGTLAEDKVPETKGVYLIYEDESMCPIYVGVTKKSIQAKPSGNPSGLRFRIMKNHMGKIGSDNFLKSLATELTGDEKQTKQAVEYVKGHCSCQWLEAENQREAFLLEHSAIAVFNPRLNSG